jgi:hypothetical protein
MTPEQQNSLFDNLAICWMAINRALTEQQKTPRTRFLGTVDAGLLARCVLQTGEPGPGLEKFFTNLARSCPQAAEEARLFIESCSLLSKAHTTALEIIYATRMRNW